MKYTLLDLTQTILSSLDSDQVDQIDETTESLQIVKIIRDVYFDIVNRADIPRQFALFQLEETADNTKPVLMTLPEEFESAQWIKYNTATEDDEDQGIIRFTDIYPVDLETFLNRMYSMNNTDTNTDTFTHDIDASTVTFIYKTNAAPTYYTTIDDGTVIFDAIDTDVDTILTAAKTLCRGKKNIEWTETNLFVPDLDDKQFSLLLNEAKSLAYGEFKQMAHPLAERNARRHWIHSQKEKVKIPTHTDLDALPNFGRK